MKDPLVSIIFISYNQQPYVRAALRSALKQDYPNLEIVVGDDGSTDGTREIIEEELARCSGAAKVRLFPRTANMGLKRNFNRCAAACQGSYVLCFAGDDVSDPRRARAAADFFKAHPACFAIFTNARVVDGHGTVLRSRWFKAKGDRAFFFSADNPTLHQGLPYCGAAAAYHAEVFKSFPPLRADAGAEDGPLALRALMLGEAWNLGEVLVDWRWHGGNLSHGSRSRLAHAHYRAKLCRLARWPWSQKIHYEAYLADIAHARDAGIVDPETARRLLQLAEFTYFQNALKYHSVHPRGRWVAVCRCTAEIFRHSPRSRWQEARFAMKCWLKKLLPVRLRAAMLWPFSKF